MSSSLSQARKKDVTYCAVQNFCGSLLKTFQQKNIDGLAALHSKSARINSVSGQDFGKLVMNHQMCQNFVQCGNT